VIGIIALLVISLVSPVQAGTIDDLIESVKIFFGYTPKEGSKIVMLSEGNEPITTYGNGWKKIHYADGHISHTDGIRTFQRWDGEWRPQSEWNTTYINTTEGVIADGGTFKSIFHQRKNTIVTDKFSFSQQPSALRFLNIETKEHTKILDATAASQITLQNNKLVYEDIYPDMDYEFIYDGIKLKEDIVSHKTDYPASPYPLDKTYLVFSTKLWEFSGIHKLMDDDGEVIIDKDVKGILKLKNVNEDVLAYLPIGDASSLFVNQTCYNETTGEPYLCNQTKTTTVRNRVIKVDGIWYLFSGINYAWVKDANRTGDITIDPTWVVGSGGGNAWSGNVSHDNTTEVQATGKVELRQEVDDYVSYWRFDEGSGTNANDENTTNNNDGTLKPTGSESIWNSSSMYGDYALDFDGTDDYVDCGNDMSLNPTDAITIEAWVRVDTLPASSDKIINKQDAWLFDIRNPSGSTYEIRFYNYGGASGLNSAAVDVGKWIHATVTFDKDVSTNNTKLYINGVISNQLTNLNTIPSNNNVIYMGSYLGTSFYLDGTIDEVRIYNRALSNNEINQTMDNEHKTEGNLTSWHDAGSGNETYKLSANFTFPANTNASINLYNNDTGAFIETLATYTTTTNWNATITSPVQDSKVNITLYGNVSQTPEVHNITFHTQASVSGTTPSISNTTNGSINTTAHWIDWDVNQSCANRIKYSNESDLTPTYWSNWENNTATPNITISVLSPSTTYYFQAWSYNTTNNILTDNSTTFSFTTPTIDTTFTVSLPTGYTYAHFQPPNSTATNYDPEGQSSINYTNWYNSSWSYRKQWTITNVNTTTLTNYPAYINVTDEPEMQADWDDVIFTDSNNNLIAYELENYTADFGDYWVNISFLPASGTYTGWIYYGNDGASSQENPEGVYDSNTKMVHHLQEAPANDTVGHLDSTSNDNDGTPKNFNGIATSTTDGMGLIDGANVFDGYNDYISCGNDPSLNITDAITIEAWVKSAVIGTSQSNHAGIVATNGYKLDVNVDGDGKFFFRVYTASGQQPIAVGATISEAGQWYFVVAQYTGSKIRIYVNGVLEDEENRTGAINVFGGLDIGRETGDANRHFNGTIDEVRIYNRALSADEINQSYQLTTNQSSFVEWGSEEKYTTPFYQVTNMGNVNLDVIMQLNSTIADIVLKADTDNNSSGAQEINTTQLTIYSSLQPDNCLNVWIWSDFNHTVEQQTNKTLYINVTQL